MNGPSLLVDTLEHGTVVIVRISCQTLTTIDSHDLSRAEAGVVGSQEKKRVSHFLGIVELAHEGDLGSGLIKVGLVLLWSELHRDQILSVGAGL